MSVFFAHQRPERAATRSCASCAEPIVGELVPTDLDGIVYAFCRACALEHPRSGRYSFDDASKVRDSVRSGRSRRSELDGGKARQ